MSARDPRRRRVLSPEERVLWSTVTRSIAPLRDAPPAVQDEEAAESAMSPAPAERMASPVAPKPVPSPPPLTPPLTPLGRRMRARVARGKEAIYARLDLHGLTQSEAHAALLHFLRSASARGARLVLVITGKGQRSEGESGVLRRQVPHWLRLPEFRVFVIGFEDAHIAHGGEGALYVRLRRPRGE
jgi:DNA-nicking Smr family endonuclease